MPVRLPVPTTTSSAPDRLRQEADQVRRQGPANRLQYDIAGTLGSGSWGYDPSCPALRRLHRDHLDNMRRSGRRLAA